MWCALILTFRNSWKKLNVCGVIARWENEMDVCDRVMSREELVHREATRKKTVGKKNLEKLLENMDLIHRTLSMHF